MGSENETRDDSIDDIRVTEGEEGWSGSDRVTSNLRARERSVSSEGPHG
jgi:hypothetical protein